MKKRNKFSLSNYKLFTCNQGELVPCGQPLEVLPGDTIQQVTNALVRLPPLNAPVMHPVHARIHHYFVPTRILWDDWEDFITGGPDGLDTSVLPTITASPSIGSLADYMGIPTGSSITFNALPFRAYAKIWNENYRHQDLQTELAISTSGGPDTTTSVALQNVNWEKDYFTAASTDTQKGTEINLPLGTSAPVAHDATTTQTIGAYSTVAGANSTIRASNAVIDAPSSWGTPDATLYADLTSATAATINQLREAIGKQRHMEAMQRFGSRYTEYLRYLGVTSQIDGRLQRPEYLGGGRQTIQFSEILQTGVDSTDSGVGNLKGHGIGAMRTNRYRRFIPEHGYIISLLSVKPKTIYSQGLAKMWSRAAKEDFFQPTLANIGMQEILNKEVYSDHSTPDGTFAYQDVYDEYRKSFSSISGEFRNGGGLEHWHMARIFSSDPAFNASFVSANPTNRIYASTSTDQLYIMANNSIQARRLIPRSGKPSGVML
jgi:hypothetical protein